MVGSSKILTVSYGTFSCTLEGFDESFETMKAIAEYFRDLAADDRYFGAEPPTPDADMLARIAEREVARRVEAHQHEGRIVLRAQQTETAAGVPGVAADAAPATEARSEAAPGDAPEPEPQPAPEPVAEAETEVEAGEAETADADADHDTAHHAEADEDTAATDAVAGAGTGAEAPVADDSVASEEPRVQEGIDDAAALAALEPEGIEREDAQPIPDMPSGDGAPILSQPDDETSPQGPAAANDDLSARLDLIRSVVGASEGYDEDEHAQDFADATGAQPLAWDDAESAPDEPAMSEAGPAGTAGPVAEDEAQDMSPTGPDEPDQAVPGDAQADSEFEDTLAALLADAAPVGAQAAPDAPDPAVAESGDRRAARVVKVSRADLEAARAHDLMATGAEAGEDTVNIFGDEADALSPEDEAALQRELASLDDELDEESGPAGTAEASEATDPVTDSSSPAPEAAPSEAPSAQSQGGKRTEVSRIFDETDNQLADPGSVRRRNTIQHLRAALAATRAEKAAGANLENKTDATPYRGDLDATVRPRRAIAASDAPRSARPEEPRPAPLKLVAEQRVDTPRPKVRPRRVSNAPAELVESQDKGFSAFAEELGATDLPDLLEAAAAYLSDVEGRSQFSRPMLMGKLREIDEEGFSREDGLRSFGQLLREGKLQKLSGGRFAVTEETEFRGAAQRRAG